VRRSTVIVTRPSGDTFARSLEQHGFKTILLPLFSLQARQLKSSEKDRLLDLKSYSWLVFTSQHGVRYAHQLLDAQLPSALRVAVIGKKTAQAFVHYFKKNADFIGDGASSEQFVQHFIAQYSPPMKIILFTALEHRGVFTKIARARGFTIDELPIYEQVALPAAQKQIEQIKLELKESLIWPFFSPSAVRACVQLGADMQSLINAGTIFSIGSVTTEALTECGLGPVREPDCHTEDGMRDLICRIHEV
jgi:uroporphyrinogen-III synthase